MEGSAEIQSIPKPEIPAKQILKDITSAQPQAEWVTYIPEKQYGVTVSLPHESKITGTLTYLENDSGEMYIDIMHVNEKVQKGGVGTRLLKSLVATSVGYGATSLFGHFTSEAAIKTMAKVFGGEKLGFYKISPVNREREKLDLTYEQALRRASDIGSVDYGIEVDLKGIDISSWEQPKQQNT